MVSDTLTAVLKRASRVFALIISILLGCSLLMVPRSFGATAETEAEITEAQKAIEESAQAYDQATARAQELSDQIAASEQRIGELRAVIPIQQKKSASALKELYRMEREGFSLIDVVLSAESFSDLITNVDYINRIHGSHIATLNELEASKAELEQTRESLSQACEEAQQEAEKAQQALAAAQKAREEAQAKAAREAAEEKLRAAKAVQEALVSGRQAPANTPSGDLVVTPGGDVEALSPPANDGVNWNSSKEAFVNEWTGRINAYLAGSPLAGYGEDFATAAWDYGVDPRWSPAISCVESSKGAVCFRSHNAWGWGQVSWSSWSEAIQAHVAGLARGYGYTISQAAAQKYCPPTWSDWYNKVSAQMDLI